MAKSDEKRDSIRILRAIEQPCQLQTPPTDEGWGSSQGCVPLYLASSPTPTQRESGFEYMPNYPHSLLAEDVLREHFVRYLISQILYFLRLGMHARVMAWGEFYREKRLGKPLLPCHLEGFKLEHISKPINKDV